LRVRDSGEHASACTSIDSLAPARSPFGLSSMSLDSRRLHSRRERFPNEQAGDLETKSERNQPRVETDKIALCFLRSLSLAFLAVEGTGLTAAVLLVGANCFTRLRSQDAVDGSVIITSAREPAL